MAVHQKQYVEKERAMNAKNRKRKLFSMDKKLHFILIEKETII